MHLYDEFFAIIRGLESASVRYAAIGGVALAFHDVPRFTRDIDLLILPDELDSAIVVLSRNGFVEASPPWTFRKSDASLHRFIKTEGDEHLVVDLVVGREHRHEEIVENAVPSPSETGPVRIATRDDLIWLKEQRGSDQDQVDIKRLRDDQD